MGAETKINKKSVERGSEAMTMKYPEIKANPSCKDCKGTGWHSTKRNGKPFGMPCRCTWGKDANTKQEERRVVVDDEQGLDDDQSM